LAGETAGVKPYSKDLRLRVLAAVDRGMPRAEAAWVFGVSASSIRRYLRLRRETGDVDPKPVPGLPARKGTTLVMALPAQIEANPLDITLSEHCELFEEVEGVTGLHRHDEPRLQETRAAAQKKSFPASERDEEERKSWHEGVVCLDPRRLVFLEE
jgi:transposase